MPPPLLHPPALHWPPLQAVGWDQYSAAAAQSHPANLMIKLAGWEESANRNRIQKLTQLNTTRTEKPIIYLSKDRAGPATHPPIRPLCDPSLWTSLWVIPGNTSTGPSSTVTSGKCLRKTYCKVILLVASYLSVTQHTDILHHSVVRWQLSADTMAVQRIINTGPKQKKTWLHSGKHH